MVTFTQTYKQTPIRVSSTPHLEPTEDMREKMRMCGRSSFRPVTTPRSRNPELASFLSCNHRLWPEAPGGPGTPGNSFCP